MSSWIDPLAGNTLGVVAGINGRCYQGTGQPLQYTVVSPSVATAAKGAHFAQVYGVVHFQQNIERQKLLKGGRNADPFVIAKAASEGRCVVTMERFKVNGA